MATKLICDNCETDIPVGSPYARLRTEVVQADEQGGLTVVQEAREEDICHICAPSRGVEDVPAPEPQA